MFTFYDGIVNVLAEQSVADLCEMFYIEIRICHAVKQCRGVQHAIAISTALQESITACHYFLTLRKIFQTLLHDQTAAVIWFTLHQGVGCQMEKDLIEYCLQRTEVYSCIRK